jgi:hypothetical protein
VDDDRFLLFRFYSCQTNWTIGTRGQNIGVGHKMGVTRVLEVLRV